jgi:tetraacyldisaccharide 4'-kinase
MRTPEFWDRPDAWSRLSVAALTPVGWLYGAAVAAKRRNATPYRAAVPVICVGNLTAGGTGKTPVAITVADALKARGRRPYFLSRGYGGSLRGPVLVGPQHTATDVGDEPLLLAASSPTIVSRDRSQGARLAVERGADVLVMDDGHQNFSLAKDLSLIVVDAEQKFGNGRLLPAGPLREFVHQGLARANAIVILGEETLPNGFSIPVLRAHLEPTAVNDLRSSRVIAFAGIGRPEKFFRTLRACGAEIVHAATFGDHHRFTQSEISSLRRKAQDDHAVLVTTEKDYVRLGSGARHGIRVLPVRAVLKDPKALAALLDRAVAPR